MIFLDCETTGLILNEALPLAQQPRIIEIGVVKTNPQGEIWETFGRLINPGTALPPEITKITGLTDADMARGVPFVECLGPLFHLFLGETELIAHNASFDHMALVFELARLGKQYRFPYPMLVTDSKTRFAGKMQDWGKRVRGEAYVQTHRALEDALLLRECWFSGVRDEE